MIVIKSNLFPQNKKYLKDKSTAKEIIEQNRLFSDQQPENTIQHYNSETEIKQLLSRIQPKSINDEPPIFRELNSLLSQSLRETPNCQENRIKDILEELKKYKELISTLKADKGLLIKRYSCKLFSFLHLFSKKINIEYLIYKINKLEHFATEMLQYTNAAPNSYPILITELALNVARVEDRHANPLLDEHISNFGKALTLAARTCADDFNLIMKEGIQPQGLNGVIAGLAAGSVDIIGSCLSENKTVFKKMDDKINKNMLIMKIKAISNVISFENLKKDPEWILLEPRIDKIINKHTNLSKLPSLLRGKTSSSQLKRQALTSSLSELSSEAISSDSVANIIHPAIHNVLQLENYLTQFAKDGNKINLPNNILNEIENILDKIDDEKEKIKVADYIWERLNSHKYYHRTRKSGITIRQKYKTPLDILLPLFNENNSSLFIKHVGAIRNLQHANYLEIFNYFHDLLETTTKSKIIENMYIIRLSLQYNSKLTQNQKSELYERLFHKRLCRDHGNLRKIANGARKDSLKRKFAIDFFRYCLHNSSTIEAILPQYKFVSDNQKLNILNVDDLANQIARWNAFQGAATISRSNFTNEIIELSHTLNTINDLNEENLRFFNSPVRNNVANVEEATGIEEFEKNLKNLVLNIDLPKITFPDAIINIENKQKQNPSIHIKVHKEHSPYADIEREEEVEIELDDKDKEVHSDKSLKCSIYIENKSTSIEKQFEIKQADNSEIVEEYKQDENLHNMKLDPSTVNLLQYQFNRLQDLTENNVNMRENATLPNIVHMILAQTNENKVNDIKNFYQLSKIDSHLKAILNDDSEQCSITEFDNLVTSLLSLSNGSNGNKKYSPLVILTLLYGCIMQDKDEDNRAEKLTMLNEIIENINDNRSLLFKQIAPSIMKTFIIEMTISSVCASLYGVAYTFTFPFAILVQLVVNWLRISANDSRTITFLSRKIVTTNREKALKQIKSIIELENFGEDKNNIKHFYKDLKKRNLEKYIPEKYIPKKKDNLQESIQQDKIKKRIKREANGIIDRLKNREEFIRAQDNNQNQELIVSPATFLLALNEELKLDSSIDKSTLIRKLLLLRQIISDYPFNAISHSNINEYKALLLASILVCMRNGVIAPSLRQAKASGADAFIAKENILTSITTLIPKIGGNIFPDNVISATALGAGGDALGTFTSNALQISKKSHPKGYRKIMKIFKEELLSLDLSEIKDPEIIKYIQTALNIHTSNYWIGRIGKTDSKKTFAVRQAQLKNNGSVF